MNDEHESLSQVAQEVLCLLGHRVLHEEVVEVKLLLGVLVGSLVEASVQLRVDGCRDEARDPLLLFFSVVFCATDLSHLVHDRHPQEDQHAERAEKVHARSGDDCEKSCGHSVLDFFLPGRMTLLKLRVLLELSVEDLILVQLGKLLKALAVLDAVAIVFRLGYLGRLTGNCGLLLFTGSILLTAAGAQRVCLDLGHSGSCLSKTSLLDSTRNWVARRGPLQGQSWRSGTKHK